MANPARGEITFEAQGKTWTLVYTVNAICDLEEQTGQSIAELGAMLSGAKPMTGMRALFWGGLRKHHPEVTLEGAGDLVQDIGSKEAVRLFSEALNTEADDPANPR
jgi:hypothetical protein